MKKLSLFFIITALLPLSARAHHGKMFLVTSGYQTAEKGEFFGLFSTNYLKGNQELDSWEFEPGVIYGVTNRLSFELHSHSDLADNQFSWESVGLEGHFKFWGSQDLHAEAENSSKAVFSVAALAEFEKGLKENPNGIEGRFIAGADFKRFSLALNLIGEKILEKSQDFEFGYAVAGKYNLLSALAVGLELTDHFEHSDELQITPGFYSSFLPHLDLRLGASFPANSKIEGYTLRTTFIYSL